ncbi:MAG: hypothetical protein AB7F89_25720, partial [Pirellulaceae bacterium]
RGDELVQCGYSSGTGLVLDDDFRTNTIADVGSEHAGVGIEASARAERDDQAYRLVFEIGGFVLCL